MRDTWTPPEALALGSDQNESQLPSPADPVPEAHQLQPQHPQQTPAAQHPLLGTAPEQQYQLQSQFAGRPLQSPATPAWGTDRIAVVSNRSSLPPPPPPPAQTSATPGSSSIIFHLTPFFPVFSSFSFRALSRARCWDYPLRVHINTYPPCTRARITLYFPPRKPIGRAARFARVLSKYGTFAAALYRRAVVSFRRAIKITFSLSPCVCTHNERTPPSLGVERLKFLSSLEGERDVCTYASISSCAVNRGYFVVYTRTLGACFLFRGMRRFARLSIALAPNKRCNTVSLADFHEARLSRVGIYGISLIGV